MTILRKDCPCCGDTDFSALISFPAVPLSGVFRTRLTEPISEIDLDHELCTRCGLVRQRYLARPPAYHGVSRSTASQLPSYSFELAEALKGYGISSNDLVYEIGSNEGTFLSALARAGISNLVGVEPSVQLSAAARAKGFRVENEYFGAELAAKMVRMYGSARAVVCRHTLEHVPDPVAFMSAVRSCFEDLSAGVVLVEVPDGSAIPELMNVYELWDEHFYCFGQENIGLLFSRAGIKPLSVYVVPHLETRNLVAWGRPTPEEAAVTGDRSRQASSVEIWLQFKHRWPRYRDALGNAIRSTPSPVYFVGASHAQTNLINFLDVGSMVGAMIDDDPVKIGTFPPIKGGSPAIIASSEFYSTAHRGSLVLTGFGYAEWMKRLSDHARSHGIAIIDPRSYAVDST